LEESASIGFSSAFPIELIFESASLSEGVFSTLALSGTAISFSLFFRTFFVFETDAVCVGSSSSLPVR
jgi:hypothetical protein